MKNIIWVVLLSIGVMRLYAGGQLQNCEQTCLAIKDKCIPVCTRDSSETTASCEKKCADLIADCQKNCPTHCDNFYKNDPTKRSRCYPVFKSCTIVPGACEAASGQCLGNCISYCVKNGVDRYDACARCVAKNRDCTTYECFDARGCNSAVSIQGLNLLTDSKSHESWLASIWHRITAWFADWVR